MELKTYGDLKKVLKAIQMNQKGQKIVSQGKEVALDALLGLIPGAGAAKTVLGFLQAAVKKPDGTKTKTWLDKLDVDDKVSQIVDDTIENSFMDSMAKKIEGEADDKELSDEFNMNTELQNYLSNNFDKRTVSYMQEQLVKHCVRKMLRTELKKQKNLIGRG